MVTKTAQSDATKKVPKSACLFCLIRVVDLIRCCAEKGSAGGRKKLTPFNKFMQTEVARLKEQDPNMPHKERSVATWSLPWRIH